MFYDEVSVCPPHEFNLDFPHLMLRYRAVENKKQKLFTQKQISETDRNGKLAGAVAPVANWATDCSNKASGTLLQSVAGIDSRAELPKFHGKNSRRAPRVRVCRLIMMHLVLAERQ